MSILRIKNPWQRPSLGRIGARCCTLLAAILLSGAPTAATLEPVPCRDAIGAAVGDDHVVTATGTGSVIAIEVDEPGLLAVQAEVDADGSAIAWVDLAPCPSRASAVGGFFDRGLLSVRTPRTVYLGVGLVDGATPPTDLRLSTRWFASPRGFDKDGEDGSDTEEEEDEILPISWPGSSGPLDAELVDHRGGFGKDGEDGSDTEEEEDEILPIQAPGGPWLVDCQIGEPYDDLRLCARSIERGTSVDGRLDATPHGRDLDYFTFTVASVEAVRFLAEGPEGFVGTLFDARGRALVRSVIDDAQFALDLVLVPGRYYVRAEGWGENDYRLEIESVQRGR